MLHDLATKLDGETAGDTATINDTDRYLSLQRNSQCGIAFAEAGELTTVLSFKSSNHGWLCAEKTQLVEWINR